MMQLDDIVGMERPVGTYTVTVALDPAGAVAEGGSVDTTDQVAVFTFEVG